MIVYPYKLIIMKLTVFVCILCSMLLAGSITASAQYNDIYRRGVNYFSDGEKLTDVQLSALLDRSDSGITLDDVEKYRKGFKTGRGLLIGFGTLTGVGLLTTGIGTVGLMIEGVAVGIGTAFVGPLAALGGADPAIAFDSKFYGVTVAGVCATLTGIAGIVAGTTVLCVYKKRMNTVADVCNSAPSVTLSFGAQKYGTGVALNF